MHQVVRKAPSFTNFDKAASIYDATRSLPDGVMKRTVDRLSELIGRQDSLLDLGVGTGRFGAPLRERGFRVVGVDVSRNMMAIARNKGLPDLVQSVAQTTPFRDGSFQMTLLVHFIHLVEDWVNVVKEIGRVTLGSVVAVANESSGPQLRQRYAELRARMKLPVEGLIEGEKELAMVIPPRVKSTLETYTEVLDLKKEVAHFERRLSAVTWDVPDTIHNAIVAKMKQEFRGKVRVKNRLFMLQWKAKDFRRVSSHPST